MSVTGTLQRLSELERAYNGPIPPGLLDIARYGSPWIVSLLDAAGRRAFYAEAVRSQIRIIRKRRRDGSFYVALLDDLRLYRSAFRAAHRRCCACASALAGEGITMDTRGIGRTQQE